jgi:hypothetical protein
MSDIDPAVIGAWDQAGALFGWLVVGRAGGESLLGVRIRPFPP